MDNPFIQSKQKQQNSSPIQPKLMKQENITAIYLAAYNEIKPYIHPHDWERVNALASQIIEEVNILIEAYEEE